MPKQINQSQTEIKTFRQAAVIGLGLIGGSIARALHSRAGMPVIGLDTDPTVVRQAIADQVLTDGAAISADISEISDREHTAWELIRSCDIVFICTPVSTVAALANKASEYCDGLITDAAGIKQPVLDQIPGDRFIGGHPMAGSERQGYAFSSESLFENAVYVLCLRPDSNIPYTTVQRLERLIRQIGAIPLLMDAHEHDRAVATVSHLPHVVASALSLLAARLDDNGLITRLAAGGFRDITRIASSDPDLWRGISLESRAELLPVLELYQALLDSYIDAIRTGNSDLLYQLFFEAGHYRDQLPVSGRGALSAHSVLTVHINDQPGELGLITTLLGNNGINISNIRIREQRHYEGGCLQLLLPDGREAIRAAWLLKEAGYVCD